MANPSDPPNNEEALTPSGAEAALSGVAYREPPEWVENSTMP